MAVSKSTLSNITITVVICGLVFWCFRPIGVRPASASGGRDSGSCLTVSGELLYLVNDNRILVYSWRKPGSKEIVVQPKHLWLIEQQPLPTALK